MDFADEGGEEGAVDGLSPGTWLGEKRPMPWHVKEKSNKYIPKNNFHVFVYIPLNSSSHIIS